MIRWLFIFLLIFSCSNGPDTLVFPPGSMQPVVTGIYITNENEEELGVLGNPSYSHSATQNSNEISLSVSGIEDPAVVKANLPYPNPSSRIVTLRFSLLKRAKVNIFAVKAHGSDDFPESTFNLIGNAHYLAATNEPIKLIEEKVLQEGLHKITFDIPEYGFYRIYFQTENFLTWVDVLNIDIDSWFEFFGIY